MQTPQIDAKIYLALKTHMDTFTGAAIHYSPSVPVQPVSSTPYLIIDDVRLDQDERYIGATEATEYRGVWSISVMVPMQWTGGQAVGLASNVCDHFDKGAWYSAAGVRVQVLKRPRIVGTGYQDAGMIRVPVLVNWRAVG